MMNQNKNSKSQKHQRKSANSNNISRVPYLYGMTLEEYKEGQAIHSKCFDQLKTIKTGIHH